MKKNLKNLYNIYHNHIKFYHPKNYQKKHLIKLNKNNLLPNNHPLTKNSLYKQILKKIKLLKKTKNTFNQKKITHNNQTPIFFNSTLTNFNIQTFLKTFIKLTPTPYKHKTQNNQIINPYKKKFSNFIFKIQTNINPTHHNQITFIQIYSKTFKQKINI